MRTTQAGESALLLLDAILFLERERLPYAVVGAMAVSVHGMVRASNDADAVVALPIHRLDEVEQRFRAGGFQTVLRRGDPEDPIAAVLELGDAFGNKVDLLVGLRGLPQSAFARAVEVPFQDVQVRVIGREDLIAMKLFAGSPQDVADAQFVLTSSASTLDGKLLESLAHGYGAETVAALEKLLDRD
jgi:hypothetical protein